MLSQIYNHHTYEKYFFIRIQAAQTSIHVHISITMVALTFMMTTGHSGPNIAAAMAESLHIYMYLMAGSLHIYFMTESLHIYLAQNVNERVDGNVM